MDNNKTPNPPEETHNLLTTVFFLYPPYLKKKFHLDKEDEKEILQSFSDCNVTSDFFVSLFSLVLGIYYLTKFMVEQPETMASREYYLEYLYAFIAYLLLIAGSSLTIVCSSIRFIVKRPKPHLERFCNLFLPLLLLSVATLFLFENGRHGEMNEPGAISPAIFWLAVVAIAQCAHYVEESIVILAGTIDIITCISIIQVKWGISQFHQYIIIVIGFFFFTVFFHNLIYAFFCQEHYIKVRNKELSVQAIYDPLTYCQNRAGLSEYIKRLPTSNKTMALVMFDIDSFKLYNDQFSHKAGDEVLTKIAQAIKDLYRNKPDIPFFRYGGDEFLLFYDIDNEKELANELGKLKQAIVTLDLVAPKGAPAPYCTVSIGSVFFSTYDASFDEVFNRVDASLYNSKNFGKNHISIGNKIIDPRGDAPIDKA